MWRMRSLRVRLLLIMAIVLSIAALAVGLTFSRLTTVQFDRYLAMTNANHPAASLAPLLAYHDRMGSWSGVDSLLERQAADGKTAALVEVDGTIHAPRRAPFLGARLKIDADGTLSIEQGKGTARELTRSMLLVHGAPLRDSHGARVGTYYFLPTAAPEPPLAREQFLGGMRRGLVVALLLAGALAALLMLAFLGRMVRPIEALTAAARRMESGDREARVVVRTRDEIGELAHAFNAMADSG